jgi:putative membrane protein
VVLLGGGLWHILGKFQDLMEYSAAPIIILIGLWIFLENYFIFKTFNRKYLTKFTAWSISVILISILIESLGVHTGLIFGGYQYGENLPPYILGVPLSIGFAWLMMLLASGNIIQLTFSKYFTDNGIIITLSIATLMLIFDIFMEPAATKLGYWSWQNGKIPLQNYIAWFVIGSFFAYVGFRLRLFNQKLSDLGIHLYIAQILYFILVYFS